MAETLGEQSPSEMHSATIFNSSVINATSLINDAKAHVKLLMKDYDPSHDYAHVERVYKNAMVITRHELANDPLVEIDYVILALGALFHDIADFKYEVQTTHSLEHPAEARLRDFFNNHASNNVTFVQKKEIANIVVNSSFRKELQETPETVHGIEFKIVRDADRLDAIGAIGIARCFGYSCIKKQLFYQKHVQPITNITAEQYNSFASPRTGNNQHDSSAYNHFYEKLLLLKDRMATKTGKKLAEERHVFMKIFLHQMKKEMDLE